MGRYSPCLDKPEKSSYSKSAFKCRRNPKGAGRRIVNPVKIRNGTATVSAEGLCMAKAGH